MNYNTQNKKIASITEKTLIVGIDVGSTTHYARAFDWRNYEYSKKPFAFSNNEEGFMAFKSWIEDIAKKHGKDKIIPVEFDELLPEKSGDIRYEEKDGVLTVVIKTMRPRHDDNITEYEKTVEEICKRINNYSKVVFDFRDNGGGYVESFTPIITAMIYGKIDALHDDRIGMVNECLYTGKTDMLTKTVANRRILEGNMMSAFYHEHKNERYYTYPEPEKKPELSNKAFKGKIFVITNTNTCSAAEYSLAALKYFFKDQVIQLGIKTGGLLDFGGAYTYILPESKLKMCICCCDLSGMIILGEGSGWRGDTEGFYPDIWFFSGDEKNIRKYIIDTK